MNKKNFKYSLNLLILLLSIALIGCGSKGSPTGGKKDTIKPEIIVVNPDQFSDISDTEIEITFSKPIKKNSILTGISIYPPILSKKFIWDSNILTIRIQEELQDSSNYFFHFNKNIKCTHGNALDKEYDFVFHTGSLNQYSVEGLIEYEENSDFGSDITMNIFSADSTFIRRETAKAYYFAVKDLNPTAYEIRAFIDKNENERYDANKEPFARQYIPYNIAERPTLNLAYQDTVKPKIRKHIIYNSSAIEIEFTEKINTPENIVIYQDSTEIELPIIAQSFNGEVLKLLVSEQDTLRYKIQFEEIADFKGNINENPSLLFSGTTIQDTIPPEVISTYPRTGSTISTLKPKLKIEFDEIILAKDFTSVLYEVETNKTVQTELLESDSDFYLLTPNGSLNNLSSYRLEINFSDSKGNRASDEYQLLFIPIIRKND